MSLDGSAYECRYAKAFWFFERVSSEQACVAKAVNSFLAKNFDHMREHTLVDVGAGYGTLSRLIDHHFRNRIAIEPNRYAVRNLWKYYDVVLHEKYDPEFRPPNRSVVLLSQSLYFFGEAQRRYLLARLISSIDDHSLICVAVDMFSNEFGAFLLRWLRAFRLTEQIILPQEIFGILESIADAKVAFIQVGSELTASNFLKFSRAISVYFDGVDDAWHATDERYRRDLYAFRNDHRFSAQNMVGIWLVSKRRP